MSLWKIFIITSIAAWVFMFTCDVILLFSVALWIGGLCKPGYTTVDALRASHLDLTPMSWTFFMCKGHWPLTLCISIDQNLATVCFICPNVALILHVQTLYFRAKLLWCQFGNFNTKSLKNTPLFNTNSSTSLWDISVYIYGIWGFYWTAVHTSGQGIWIHFLWWRQNVSIHTS